MSNQYLTMHNSWDANLMVPLIVAKFRQDVLYVEPMWGVKIHRVVADRTAIPGKPHEMDLDDANFRKIQAGDLPLVYQVRFNDFIFAKTFSEAAWTFEKYELPRSANVIRIEYQGRESETSLGPVCVIESRLVD